MADYAKQITDNEKKISDREGWIARDQVITPRTPEIAENLLTWRQEIDKLKLEIEILEIKAANPGWGSDDKIYGRIEKVRDKHAQQLKELGERQVELERARTHSRPGDTQAIGSLGEKVARLELESQLRNAKSTTTRVEVYADFEEKNLISTLKLTGSIPKFEDFKTNKWTAALRVCPILVVVFDELTILVSF